MPPHWVRSSDATATLITDRWSLIGRFQIAAEAFFMA